MKNIALAPSLAVVLAAAIDLDAFEFFLGDSERPLRFLNDAGSLDSTSVFFLAGHEFGPTALIHVNAYRRGDGFDSAYEAWIDDMKEIGKSELPEAYSDPRDAEGRTFDDIARDMLYTGGDPYPPSGKTEDIDAWLLRKETLALRLLQECADAARDNVDGQYPEIVEGYREDNSGNVKDVGHYESFCEADLDTISIRAKGKEVKPKE